jgi:hypothetical protein
MTNGLRLQVEFFKTEAGNEPVREWIKSLPRHEQKTIGADIKVVNDSSNGDPKDEPKTPWQQFR